MNYIFRPLQAEDYTEVTEIYNSQKESHHRVNPDYFARAEERARGGSFLGFLVAVQDGEVVAAGQIGERLDDKAPGRYWAEFHVREDHRGEGMDSALFDAAVQLLEDRVQQCVWTSLREDFVPAAEYLRERHFEEQFRSWGVDLNLARFNTMDFAGYEQSLALRGIEIRRYAELAGDAQPDAKLADLQATLEEDAPHHEPIIPKRHPTPNHPRMLLDCFVVAVHDGKYVGTASLLAHSRSGRIAGSGLVGVLPEFHNQGIGTALRASTCAWAKEHEYEEVNAGGAGANISMIKITRRIGFKVEPHWVTFARDL